MVLASGPSSTEQRPGISSSSSNRARAAATAAAAGGKAQPEVVGAAGSYAAAEATSGPIGSMVEEKVEGAAEEDIETGGRRVDGGKLNPPRRNLSWGQAAKGVVGNNGGNGGNGGAEKRTLQMVQRSATTSSVSGLSTATQHGSSTKLVSILKKEAPAPMLGGNGRRQGSSLTLRPQASGRAPSSMSTRFLMQPLSSSKTVRFRLESERSTGHWLAQYTQPLDPRSLFVVRWKSLCIVWLSISFFRLPVIMAFSAHGLWMDFLCDLYFFLDHLLALNTAILVPKGERLVTDRRAIAYRYFSWDTFRKGDRWCFPVFVMEFVPFYGAIALQHFVDMPDWFLPVCAVFRARRLVDLLSYFHALELRLDSDLRVLAVTKYALVMLGSAQWFGCIWWAVARFSGFGDTCWVTQYYRLVGKPINEATFRSSTYNYLLSLYWGFTVLTGELIQGYAPDNTQETILCVFSTFCQVFVFSFLLGILLHYIVKKDASQEKYNSMMDKVERYAKMHELPRRLESSIKLCFTFQHQKRIGQDEEILAAIPMTMRSKILAHRYQMVAANDIFRGCQEHFVTAILAVLRPKILIPGVTIYNRDDMTREVLFLEEGELEVYADDDALPYRMVRPTETVFPVAGAIAFFLGIPQPFAHKASIKSHVKLLTLSRDDYEAIKDRYPESRDQLIENIKAMVGLRGDDGDVLLPSSGEMALVPVDGVTAGVGEEGSGGPKKDSKEAELRRKVALGLQKKLDDDLATMFNAIEEGDSEAVKLLLDKGFKANEVDYDMRSGLHFAAAKGEDKIVELLIQRGADVHLRDRWGRNALQDAIDHGHATVTAMLAAQGAELKLQNAAGRLCAAAFADDLFELQRLVENGIDCNSGDYDGRRALHLGACEGNNKVVEYLLLPMNKCQPGAMDRWGISPLFDAIKHGNHSVARILYENGARLSKGKAATFLCTAAANGDYALLQMLFECGVETNIGDYDQRYPIHLAAAEGEVVSVEFLLYAHAEMNVRDRWGRTPLDDAIAEGHLACARMLLSFGAEHSIPLDQATLDRMQSVDLGEVRRMVKKDRTEQDQRKTMAKQLRDTVRWMATETETWVQNLDERRRHLQRTTERMIKEEERDELHLDTHAFLEQSDQSILVSERPERLVSIPSSAAGPASTYMLSRFFGDAALSGGSGGQRSPGGGHGSHALKSIQHFFLKWGLIHAALKGWKARLAGQRLLDGGEEFGEEEEEEEDDEEEMDETSWRSGGGSSRHRHGPSSHRSGGCPIDKAALGRALRTLDVHFTEAELERAYTACKHGRGGGGGEGRAAGGLGGMSVGSGSVPGAEAEVLAATADTRAVSFEDVLTALPVWGMVLRAPAAEGSDLAQLQEAVDVVCEGYRLLTRHSSGGKLGRAAWMIQKREMDMGEFASAVDAVFLERDVIDKETFFLVVARWAALRDEDGPRASGAAASADAGPADACASPRMGDSYGSGSRRPQDRRSAESPLEGRLVLRGSGQFTNGALSRAAAGQGHTLTRHEAYGLSRQPSLVMGTRRSSSQQRKGVWARLRDRYRLWRVKRKLRASLQRQAPSASTTGGGRALPLVTAAAVAAAAAMPDFERQFARLDVDHTGWLDPSRAELLLMWGFDAELAREEWALLVEALADPVAAGGKVNLAAIERLWLELMGVAVRAPSALDTSGRGGKAMQQSLPGKELGGSGALQGLGGSGRRLVGGVVLVESVPLSERLLFDGRGPFIAAWDEVMTLAALYYFLSVPFIISFLRDVILTTYASSLLVAYGFDCLLLCDVLVQLNTSFTDAACSVRVTDRQRIRNRYMTTAFLRDLLTILPLDVLVRFLGGSGTLVACLRLPKLITGRRLYTFFQRRSLSSSSRLVADLQALLFSALGMIHILTCLWFLMTDGAPANYQAVSNYEDYGDYTNHPEGGGPFRVEYYLYSFLLITTLISTQGIYDLVMGRVNEIVFTIVVLTLNLSAWAYLMGTISGLCVTADESIAQSHELMAAVSRFIQHNPMPPGVSEELKGYFNVNAQQKSQLSLAEQNEIYRNLPLSLQVEAARHISRDSLLSVGIFEKTSDFFLDSISTLLDMEVFGVGDFVYKADDICRVLFIVASGTVEVGRMNAETNEFEVEDVVGAGCALGQLEFLFDVRYMSTARVAGTDDVRVFRLGKEDFGRVIKLYPMDEDILYENLSRLADDQAIETGSRAPSMVTPSLTSGGSVDSSFFSALGGDDLMEKAMDSIDKAKKRSKEQRIRSFCNAAAEGNMDILQRLLRSGIDINGRDCNGRTALMVASCAGNFELVRWLVSLGADVNLRDRFGGSALLDAMNQGHSGTHLEIMGFLSQQGGVLELDDAAGVMCQAAADGNQAYLARLLEMNISPDVADYDKRTPLHLAASEGHLDCVRLLLQYWADVNPIDRMGGTPLTDAVRHKHIQVQHLLREHGGVLNMDPVELGTCACEAAASGDLENIRVLVDNGADINQGDYDGRTALHLATCCNRLSVIEYLVSLPSIELSPLDRLSHTPLDDALREGLPAIASILEAHGGVRGSDPSLADKVQVQRAHKGQLLARKRARREEAVRLFGRWAQAQGRLAAVYEALSAHLPPLCKYTNLLSMTLRSRRTTSTIDRSPKPDLGETRLYFYNSFLAFLEQRYKANLEACLSLIEELHGAASFEDKARLAGQIMERYLDARSADRLHFHPQQVEACRAQFQRAFQQHAFPEGLFEAVRASVEEKMEALLPEFYASPAFYRACRQPNGFLWRVTKLARLIHALCTDTLTRVVEPFLELCDSGGLDCVPHYQAQSRDAFRAEFAKLQGCVTALQAVLHVVAYKAKHDCMREGLRERRDKHAQLVMTGGGSGGGGDAFVSGGATGGGNGTSSVHSSSSGGDRLLRHRRVR